MIVEMHTLKQYGIWELVVIGSIPQNLDLKVKLIISKPNW